MISDEFRAIVEAITNDLFVLSMTDVESQIHVECQHNSRDSHIIQFSINYNGDVIVSGVDIINLRMLEPETYDVQLSIGSENLMDPWSISKLKKQVEDACASYTKAVADRRKH